MPIAPDTSIQYIPRGSTTSRTLRVASGASDLTLSGTYTLYDETGASASTGSFNSNAYSLTLGGSVTLGGGWREKWAFTTGGASYEVWRRVVVTETLDSRMLLVDHASLLVFHPWLASMPAGYTSWEPQCVAATREVLQVLADRTQHGRNGDLLNADAMFFPAMYAALRLIGRAGAALTQSAEMQTMADTNEAEYRDWLRRMKLDMDVDGDGVADRTDAMQPDPSGFPPMSPVRV